LDENKSSSTSAFWPTRLSPLFISFVRRAFYNAPLSICGFPYGRVAGVFSMVLSKKHILSVSMFVAPLMLNACSGSSNNSQSGAGGVSSGGTSGTGGAAATGGLIATGGKNAGGASATGGAANTGGLAAMGGANSGGTSATGGTAATGGSAATGGKSGGGTSATGGTAATGGSAATGGKSGGGTSATGGSAATGGLAATGGKSGGGTSATGGTKNTGGTTSTTCVAFNGGDVTAALFPNGLTLTKACSPYVISTVSGINVSGNGVLTIEAGATLKFDVNTPIAVGQSGQGKLVANGTALDPITLTSDVTPQQTAGDWYGIQFYSGTVSGSKLSYTKVDYAGGNFDASIVGYTGVGANLVTLDHVTVDHVGDGSNGIMEQDPMSNFVITNSTFAGIPAGNYPISVQAPSFAGIGAGNTVAAGAMVELAGGTIGTTTVWTNPSIPIAVTSDLNIDGASTPSLTLGAGINLKFADGIALGVGNTAGGKLVISGTTASHVTLTSQDAAPVAGAWAGIEVFGSSKATISYADVRYGGSNTLNSKGNLSLLAATSAGQVTVDHSTFNNSKGWGIYQSCPTGVTADANTTYATNTLGTKGPTTGTACP
jgi:hypothetical protein